MKNLTISLLIAVFTTVFGLGWILSQIHLHFEPNETAPNSELQAYQQLGYQFRHTLNQQANLSLNDLEYPEQRADFTLSIQPTAALPLPQVLQQRFKAGEPIVLDSDEGVTIHYFLNQHDQILNLNLSNFKANENKILNITLTLLFYLGVLIILLAWLYPLIWRLKQLRKLSYHYAKGNFDTRIPYSRFSYIKDIEAEFNRMADKIEALLADNRLLSRAVSHDLKTPLARLRFGVEMLADTEEQVLKDKYTQRLNHDLTEMESLVETLLAYARLEQSAINPHVESIRLDTLISNIVKQSGTSIEIVLSTNNADSPVVFADSRYLTMQLNNVIGNAIKYANNYIKISIFQSQNTYHLIIEDDGQGFVTKEIHHLTKPFYRGDSTTQISKGHGMGLAIVERVAQWHNCELNLSNSAQLGGASVEIIFPITKN